MNDFTGEHSAAMGLPLTDRDVIPPLEWDVFTYLKGIAMYNSEIRRSDTGDGVTIG